MSRTPRVWSSAFGQDTEFELGTFSVAVVAPEACFRDGNPLLLTTHGQYIIKNLVLVAAGIAIVASLRRTQAKMWGLRDEDLLASRDESP